MYKDIIVINEKEHKNKAVKSLNNFSYAKDLSSCLLLAEEFFKACKSFPILFAKDEKDEWFAVAALGLDDKNSFVNKDGEWKKYEYIPAFVRRYPFIYVENDGELLLGMDKKALTVKSKTTKRYFFEKDGKHTDFVKDVVKFLNHFQTQSKFTKDFIQKLDDLKVLEPSQITKKDKSGKEKIIGGFFVVSEEKLNKLKEEDKEKLCKENLTPLITAHLISLSNINKISL